MFAQQLVNGLTIGSAYALLALGYSLVYGILGLINFAHGDVYMFGAFFALWLFGLGQMSIWLVLVLTMAFTALLGVLTELVAYRPLRAVGASRASQLLTALGIGIVLRNLAMVIWGTQAYPFPASLGAQSFTVLAARITLLQVIIVGVSILLMVALHLLIAHTKLGLAMRACTLDLDTAGLMGINTGRVIAVTFAVGSLLAGAASIFLGSYYSAVVFHMGALVGIKSFVAAIVGGIGSIPGAVLGGFTLGLFETLGAAYVSSGYRHAFAFVALILVLLARPGGILGKLVRDKM